MGRWSIAKAKLSLSQALSSRLWEQFRQYIKDPKISEVKKSIRDYLKQLIVSKGHAYGDAYKGKCVKIKQSSFLFWIYTVIMQEYVGTM